MEVPVDQVRSDLTDLALVGAIFLDAHLALQSQNLHKPAHGLMVDDISAVPHLQRYPAIAVSALVFMVNSGYLFLLDTIFVRSLHSLQVVVIGAFWNICNL